MGITVDRFSRLAALKPARGVASRSVTKRAPEAGDALSRVLGAVIATNEYGEHISVKAWYSAPEQVTPSGTTLKLLSRVRDEAISAKTLAAIGDPEQWLFLDTETTGLSGGTGTYAFLIGLAWWEAGGLQVEQFFMRDFSEEHSILQEVSRRAKERAVLVTFNGKAFDWPLLESRFRMTRAIGVPRLKAHLDMLHPARALWKLRLGSVRLVELEREVLDAPRLGWHRTEDILSAQIPQHYFEYLRGGVWEPLAAVVRHNQMDLRGLAALVGKIDELMSTESAENNEFHSLDLFGLSRFLQRRGERERAHAACAQALNLGLPAEHRPQAQLELAWMAKREGRHEHAATIWHELADDPRAKGLEAIRAIEQLAIYYERREKNYERAAELVRLALAKLQQRGWLREDGDGSQRRARLQQKFMSRLERLTHRMMPAGQRRFVLKRPDEPGLRQRFVKGSTE